MNMYPINDCSPSDSSVLLVLFMGNIKKLISFGRTNPEIDQEQALSHRDMERYSRHIEEPYKEVRAAMIRLDLLTSLHPGNQRGGWERIKEVYDSVLTGSSENCRTINMTLMTGKSIVPQKSSSREILKARDKKIVFNVEVPERFPGRGMT